MWFGGQLFLQSEFLSRSLITGGVAASIAIIFGRFTNMMCFFCFIIISMLSDVDRSLQQGENLALRLTLFWFSLLYHAPGDRVNKFIFVLWQIQISLVYFMAGLLKIKSPMWVDLSALHYIFQLDQILTSFGSLLVELPLECKKFLSLMIIVLELSVPFLIWIPNLRLKFWVCSLMILFHVSILVTFNIGLIPNVCLVWWLSLLPGKSPLFADDFSFSIIDKGKKIIGVAAMSIVLATNIMQIHPSLHVGLVHDISRYSFLYQSWKMFNARDFARWPVIVGLYENGNSKNLITNGQAAKLNSHSEAIRSMFWRNFYRNNYSSGKLERLIPSYYCSKDHKIKSVSLIWVTKLMKDDNSERNLQIDSSVHQCQFTPISFGNK